MEKINISEIFGSMVFNDEVMKSKLPKDIYKSLHYTIKNGTDLDITVANVVANAMKDWAIEKGATHYTHWFQPMTGITAEKHDSFMSPQKDGKVIMEFSGKELIKGEPDASSFPSGGLRATFEARGYTAWDPTSYAFIKDDSLCIPTVFCSYGGDLLDKKTPLLRSMDVVSAQAIRILRLFGYNDVIRVNATVGPEQEYFLIDRELFNKRRDLFFTGRTLFGAKPPKGQELDDHYFGAIRPRVMKFMEELNIELWKLGVYANTEHNEAAPSQHELAPVYTTANVATDHNQLTMEIMKKVAERNGLACLLHEKPFEGVNGSGKHNNWSLSTASGINLFDPGKEPQNNNMFLLFLCAVIKAVDEHQDLLRVTVAGAGNDHRLGAAEAPPAIVSMFLGDDLTSVLEAIESGKAYDKVKAQKMKTGVNVLPDFQKDTTDRNRTSPFAFTGNKFEFRMLGSSFSISDPNIVLNTIVADVLSEFADRLEKADNFEKELKSLMKETIKKHKRIIFNGNNYSDEWTKEAEKRGLLNLRTTVDAIPHFINKKNIQLFAKNGIFSEIEMRSRYEIMLENYCKVLNIEVLTMLEIVRRSIMPAATAYSKQLSETAAVQKSLGIDVSDSAEIELAKRISMLNTQLYNKANQLEDALSSVNSEQDFLSRAEGFRDNIVVKMKDLRCVADCLETIVAKEYWPFPTYEELLFSV
ncbi:MAG: glutamine synthetase III [Clostridia bacterium]|nr:glutamine synthetase III [Clostridia bacterium]